MTAHDLPGTGPDGAPPPPGPAAGEEVAALRTALKIQQVAINQLAQQVRDLTTVLLPTADGGEEPGDHELGDGTDGTDGDEDGDEGRPAPWCWRNLPDHRARALWAELADWVTWLHTRYPLADTLPGCWWRHPEIVEELTAAHAAWKAAYTSPGASPYGPGEFHDRWLPGLEHRLATRWKTRRCTNGHQDTLPTSHGTPIDNPDAFSAASGAVPSKPIDRLPLGQVSGLLDSHHAELVGENLGDPIYWRGQFWRLTADADAYQPVTDPDDLQSLNDQRRAVRRKRTMS